MMDILSGLGTLKRLDLSTFGGGAVNGIAIPSAVTAEPDVKLVLHAPAADALSALLIDWVSRGRRLHINSMWRSVESQRIIRLRSPDTASKPGWSLHSWSLAVDYNTSTEQLGGGTNAAFQTLAAQYGFGNIMPSEPWHIHYLHGFDGASAWPSARPFIEALAAAIPMDAETLARDLWSLGYGSGIDEVRRFQADYGFRMADVDGIAGPQTCATVALITRARTIETAVMALYGDG